MFTSTDFLALAFLCLISDLYLSSHLAENRFLTDVRTGAAGAVSVKYLSKKTDTDIGFIGTGAIAKSMARATAAVRPGYTGYAYGHDAAMSKSFCEDMKKVRLGRACAKQEVWERGKGLGASYF